MADDQKVAEARVALGLDDEQSAMDTHRLERIESELNDLVERRARQCAPEQKYSDKLEEVWRESERRHHERQLEENRLGWIDYFLRLAESLALSSDRYRREALKLMTPREQLELNRKGER